VVKGCDEDSRLIYVKDSAWENDPIVAEVAIKPGVVEKIMYMLGDPIMERARGAEQYVERLARGGMIAGELVHF
jgi:hypothetical protein